MSDHDGQQREALAQIIRSELEHEGISGAISARTGMTVADALLRIPASRAALAALAARGEPQGDWSEDEWHTDEKGNVIGGAPANFVFVAKADPAAREDTERPCGCSKPAGVIHDPNCSAVRNTERPDERMVRGLLDLIDRDVLEVRAGHRAGARAMRDATIERVAKAITMYKTGDPLIPKSELQRAGERIAELEVKLTEASAFRVAAVNAEARVGELTEALRRFIAVTELSGTRSAIAREMERAKSFARAVLNTTEEQER